jgi:hypothetical protein
MEELCFYNLLALWSQTTRRYNPQDHNMKLHSREKLTFYTQT